MRIKKIIFFIAALVIVLFVYMNFFHVPKVLAIHGTDDIKEVLIKNIPFTDSEKIKWWERNSEKFFNKSQVYSVSLWRFDGTYLKLAPKDSGLFPDHDTDYLLCFDDVKSDKSCIDKSNWIMDITKSKDGHTYYQMGGRSYYLKPSGELMKGEIFKTKIK
ncbi:DUF943 family protein [Tatumella terrea]|uniref:DUF943 family protein n=1 Tax=Tatumella terrea TaxID=419007 RepID=A0ABW1VSM2_9GAMM